MFGPSADMAAYLAILSVCAARGDVARARLYWDQGLQKGGMVFLPPRWGGMDPCPPDHDRQIRVVRVE